MKQFRIASIDILRAITMLLMIWVNDFWTLTAIPKWLQHASATEDYMGFSDIIFPLFLFIVGLSIPYAIAQRKTKGDSRLLIAKHIFIRGLSLLIIGVFMVNYETAHHESILIGKYVWEVLMAFAVVLVWMNWKRSPVHQKWHKTLQVLGLLILIFLAIIYKGGQNGDTWMTTQWWGILGLIGWAYLLNAIVFLYSNGKMIVIVVLFLVLNILVVLNHADLLPSLYGPLKYLSTLYTGTIPAFTTAGILATLIFKKLSQNNTKWIFSTMMGIGFIMLAYGFLMRPYWGISKIQGTPAWLGICIGIGFISFAVLYVICDVKGKKSWAKIIAPAGTATLTCYMIPYFIYPLAIMIGYKFPEIFNTGIVGLMMSLLFAIVVVIFTGWLEKKGFKLKL